VLPVVVHGCETWSFTLREEHSLAQDTFKRSVIISPFMKACFLRLVTRLRFTFFTLCTGSFCLALRMHSVIISHYVSAYNQASCIRVVFDSPHSLSL